MKRQNLLNGKYIGQIYLKLYRTEKVWFFLSYQKVLRAKHWHRIEAGLQLSKHTE